MRKQRHPAFCFSLGVLLVGLVGCSSGSEDTAKTYIQTVTNACTQSGGTVSSSGAKNCDYQAVVTTSAGSTIESTDTASQTAIDSANARVSDKCEAAAQLASVQCKFDKLSSDTATCQQTAKTLVQALGAHTSSQQQSGASTDASASSASLFSTLLGSANSSTNGADCSEAFKNAYMTYMTALNGTLANSQEGCSILEANLGKVLKTYQSGVDASGMSALIQMGESLKSSGGSCPANTVMKMIYSQLGSSSPSLTVGTASSGSVTTTLNGGGNVGGLIPSQAGLVGIPTRQPTPSPLPNKEMTPRIPSSLRGFKDTRFHDFTVVY